MSPFLAKNDPRDEIMLTSNGAVFLGEDRIILNEAEGGNDQ